MIWQEKVTRVIMLTQLTEMGKVIKTCSMPFLHFMVLANMLVAYQRSCSVTEKM